MTVITNMPLYQALVLKSALKFYAETGMKVNRAYTPTNMLKLANKITGHTYRRGQYAAAAAALGEWIEAEYKRGAGLDTDRPAITI